MNQERSEETIRLRAMLEEKWTTTTEDPSRRTKPTPILAEFSEIFKCDFLVYDNEATPHLCHQKILEDGCDYFKGLFGSSWIENRNRTVHLSLFNTETVSGILDFIYSGRLPKEYDDEFYGALMYLQATSLDIAFLHAMKKDWEIDDDIYVRHFFATDDDGSSGSAAARLKLEAKRYVGANIKRVLDSDGLLLEMNYDQMVQILTNRYNSIDDEFDVLSAIVRWIQHHQQQQQENSSTWRRALLAYVKPLIDAGRLTAAGLEDSVVSELTTHWIRGNCREAFENARSSMSANDEAATDRLYIFGTRKNGRRSNDPPCGDDNVTQYCNGKIFAYRLTDANGWNVADKTKLSWNGDVRCSAYKNNLFVMESDGSRHYDRLWILNEDRQQWINPKSPPTSRTISDMAKRDIFNCRWQLYYHRPSLYYNSEETEISLFDCNVNEWFAIENPDESGASSCMTASNSCLYRIGEERLSSCVKFYDGRVGHWQSLTAAIPTSSVYDNRRTVCYYNGHLFVSEMDKAYLDVLDLTAGRWRVTAPNENYCYEHGYSKIVAYQDKIWTFKNCSYVDNSCVDIYHPLNEEWNGSTFNPLDSIYSAVVIM